MNDMTKTSSFPDEAEIHAYIDGYLDEADCARMEAWLDRHPTRAEEIRGWQRDAQQLRARLGSLPPSSGQPNLDPAVIRARRRRRGRERLALAASLVLTLGVGGIGGWQARSRTAPSAEAPMAAAPTAAAPMADALQAYRMFVADRRVQLDITQRHAGELQTWLDQRFQDAARLPDLASAGFHPVGGRLTATDSGPAAMVLYEDQRGNAISFYIRPPSPHAGALLRGQRREGQLATAYWSGNGYNYALVSRADTSDVKAMRDALLPTPI
ncbi:anti-sigma factor family protein [Lysobacter sp. A421]